MNSLKIFGIDCEKENGKYRIKKGLYTIKFSLSDLKSIAILKRSCETYPDLDVINDLKSFIKSLTYRMDEDDRKIIDMMEKKYNFSFYYGNSKENMDLCLQICKDKRSIGITYVENGKEVKLRCVPKELVYSENLISLEVCSVIKNKYINIPIPNIVSIDVTPQKQSDPNLTSTVVYKVKNRLAKTYKVKENEYSQCFESNGDQVIVNKNEPNSILLERLMRYKYNCEILTPKSLRLDMLNLIDKTLENYK